MALKRFLIASALLLSGCATAYTEPRAPAAPVLAARSFPALEAFVAKAVSDGVVPAMSVAVGVGDEPVRFISAGHLAADPASPAASEDTLWRIYSMTKPVTGVAAMILVNDGKLRLDQPVGDILPEFKSSAVLIDPANSLETRPASRAITVRDLLTHSAGMNYGISGKGPAMDALKANGVMPFAFTRASEQEMRPLRPNTLREFARRAARMGLIADPGTKFSYSMSLDVLAAVVEQASGMPYAEFLQRRLFQPLGMRSTYWSVPKEEAGRLVTHYTSPAIGKFFGINVAAGKFAVIDDRANSIFFDPPSFPYGGAGLVSTARDYDRFLHMLQNDGELDGRRILRPEIARLARSNLLPEGVYLKDFGPVYPGEETGVGAGGFTVIAEKDGFGRGRGTFGWDGAAGTRAWVDPSGKVRATMMINFIGALGVGDGFEKALAADLAAR